MKTKRFEIILPHPRTTKELIFDFFEIIFEEESPCKIAVCKRCKNEISIITGTNIYSSYTVGLKFHLRKHPSDWRNYLFMLSKIIEPDSRTVKEHFEAKQRPRFNTNKEESSRNFQESKINSDLNSKSKNIAGVCYTSRDSEIITGRHGDGDIPKILRYLHQFTNKNVHIFELIGTKHENAPLNVNYRLSKCLVNNDEDITLDLQRLLCKNVCFLDPSLYGDCEHNGSIDLFNDREYQMGFEGFDLEVEKYPDFQADKSFDAEVLKEVRIIEHDKTARKEMRRMLIIILTLLTCHQDTILKKTKIILDLATGEDNLIKPNHGIFMWGPKVTDVDAKVDDDETINYDEKAFYVHIHKNDEDCPAYSDRKKAVYKEVFFDAGRAYYPCNLGGCCQECPCIPCNCPNYKEANSFKCPVHHPDHPEMFNEVEDLSIERREYFNTNTLAPIYERPKYHKRKCPPKVKFANMKKSCKYCRKIFDDHRKNHHVLHDACQLCYHMSISSEKSFSLACHICFKAYKNKYLLAYHMNSHDDNPTFYCDKCDTKFTRKEYMDRHLKLYHAESPEVHTCSECAKSFSTKDNLKRHEKMKHMEQMETFKCSDCDKTFNRHDNLLKHKSVAHNSERNVLKLHGINDSSNDFKCMHCDKVYTQKSSLIRHLESKHKEGKDYYCKVCRKSFARKDVLVKHEKNHVDE